MRVGTQGGGGNGVRREGARGNVDIMWCFCRGGLFEVARGFLLWGEVKSNDVMLRFVNTSERIAKDYRCLAFKSARVLVSYKVRRKTSLCIGRRVPIGPSLVSCIFIARTRVSRSNLLPLVCGRNFENAVFTAGTAASLYGVVLGSSTRVRRFRTR